jgi:hypothetical protein
MSLHTSQLFFSGMLDIISFALGGITVVTWQ